MLQDRDRNMPSHEPRSSSSSITSDRVADLLSCADFRTCYEELSVLSSADRESALAPCCGSLVGAVRSWPGSENEASTAEALGRLCGLARGAWKQFGEALQVEIEALFPEQTSAASIEPADAARCDACVSFLVGFGAANERRAVAVSGDAIAPWSAVLGRLLTLHAGSEEYGAQAAAALRHNVDSIVTCACENDELDGRLWALVLRAPEPTPRTWAFPERMKLLLRFLARGKLTPRLREEMCGEAYSGAVLRALGSSVHEERKVGLSVLKLTLHLLPEGAGFGARHAVEHTALLEMWRRFVTCYEIVALDTALNQLEAASADVLTLFESDLERGWPQVVILTGLHATMESVRKFCLELMFRVRDRSAFDIAALPVLLGAALQAPNFVVAGGRCVFGEKLSAFVRDVLLAAGVDECADARLSDGVLAVLRTFERDAYSFDAARIYVSHGVLLALRAHNGCVLTDEHLRLVRLVLSAAGEEPVFDSTLQALWLEISLFAGPSSTLPCLFGVLGSHAARYGYGLLVPLLSQYRTFLAPYDKTALAGCNEVLVYLAYGVEPESVTQEFLVGIAKAGKSKAFQAHYESFIQQLANLSLKEACSECDILVSDGCVDQMIYTQIDLRPVFGELLYQFNLGRLQFFVAVFRRAVAANNVKLVLTADDLAALYAHLKSQFKVGAVRLKDSSYAAFFQLAREVLTQRLNAQEGASDVVDVILSLAESNVSADNDNYMANLQITNVLQYIMDNGIALCIDLCAVFVEKLVAITDSIWQSLLGERLVLNQKDLHLGIIKTLFHAVVLKDATDDSELSSVLRDCGQDFIRQAASRRSLLPCLTLSIKTFLLGQPSDADRYMWLTELLISVFVHTHENVNVFKLKPVVAELFDKHFTLVEAENGLYQHIYGIEEISTKVHVISALIGAPAGFRRGVVEQLLQNDSNLLKPNKRTNGPEEIERLGKWQLLLLSMKSIENDMLILYVSDHILPNLFEEPSPLVRIYSEWIVAHSLFCSYYNRDVDKLEGTLIAAAKNQTRPAVVVSAQKILYLTLVALKRICVPFRLLNMFISVLVPNCASNKPLIRHFSNSLILSLWPEFRAILTGDTVCGIMENLFSEAKKTQSKGQYRAGDANIWDLHDDFNLTSIFGGVVMKVTDHCVPYISSAYFTRYLDSTTSIPVGVDESKKWLSKRKRQIQEERSVETKRDSPLQTKSGTWETVLDFDSNTPQDAVKRSDLIVVASLVDKPPNLGGICRLSDVLGVGLMTVHDLRVKSHPQFKNVAVTADRWMPIEEVAVADIASFMRQKKLEGYTLIGLEQTDKSVRLDAAFHFPRKSLILLGTEAEGIPGYLLVELDMCLEIKQHGVIRSMNIQTATAVVVHSYAVQHM
ncbi:ADL294Cp [Eremothecium gossypii ATCC 10895]|uniref:ADL294Cp n=1 Tax=Eremothecium gossypii (strain ATCC 10895 / CBS 109.51 / FGSC 9923 / NRRL Y-1056) TaxID=284811 RepID=Q75B66_EREGS|nr:ADL294Cp [Eremothecium gossypii ATCC 10895]AAS51626.2 ADL294Cp [Eremothecium gossypii ATCC 10895]